MRTWLRCIRSLWRTEYGGTTSEYAFLLALLMGLALLALRGMGLSLGTAFGQTSSGLGSDRGPGPGWLLDVHRP